MNEIAERPSTEPASPHLPCSIERLGRIVTPALVIYADVVEENIRTTLRLLNGDPSRWRPHLKTAKLIFTMKKLIKYGVNQCKCATTLELKVALEAGFDDVLLAFPVSGAGALRVAEIAASHPKRSISVLVENADNLAMWQPTGVNIFVDINSGMNRTGIEQSRINEIVQLVQNIHSQGLHFKGLHYYEGHLGDLSLRERMKAAEECYGQLVKIALAIQHRGYHIPEVVTSGTPAFPCALSYTEFKNSGFLHRMSPGTLVYCDARSLRQLPEEFDYKPAAFVLSTIVSRPSAGRVTCDAGSKAVSTDLGDPTCEVVGRPELTPAHPSEEHLPLLIDAGSPAPSLGETLYLLPRHICPTLNNFDHAFVVSGGDLVLLESVTARGHESVLIKN